MASQWFGTVEKKGRRGANVRVSHARTDGTWAKVSTGFTCDVMNENFQPGDHVVVEPGKGASDRVGVIVAEVVDDAAAAKLALCTHVVRFLGAKRYEYLSGQRFPKGAELQLRNSSRRIVLPGAQRPYVRLDDLHVLPSPESLGFAVSPDRNVHTATLQAPKSDRLPATTPLPSHTTQATRQSVGVAGAQQNQRAGEAEAQKLTRELAESKAEVKRLKDQSVADRRDAHLELQASQAQRDDAMRRAAEAEAEYRRVVAPLLSGTEGDPLRWADRSANVRLPAANLVVALKRQLEARGAASATAPRLLAAWFSGLMPLTVGPMATQALEALAATVVAGRFALARVAPTLLDLADLFEGPRSASARAMADAFRSGHSCDRPALLCLEGINRSPTEAWLAPLLATRRFAPLPNLGVSAPYLAADVLVRTEGNLPWPRALRLGGTLVSGSTTLPLSHDLWAFAVLIPAPPSTQDAAIAPSPTEATEIAFKPVSNGVSLNAEPEVAGLEAAVARFEQALEVFEPNMDARRTALAEGILGPAVATWGAYTKTEVEAVASRLRAVVRGGPLPELKNLRHLPVVVNRSV